MSTLLEITKAVKELSFDRFLVPSLHVKAPATLSVSVQLTGIFTGPTLVVPFTPGETLGDAVDALINSGLVVATDGYFVADEEAVNLRPGQVIAAGTEGTLLRRNFFSDSFVRGLLKDYYDRVLHLRLLPNYTRTIDTPTGPITELVDTLVSSLSELDERTVPHMVLWLAWHLVAQRRLYETAAAMLGQSNWSDGSGYFNNGAAPTTNTTVSVGSVFSMTEDLTSGFIDANFDRIGSRNTLGDAYSFWFRLQVDLRSRLENRYGDYSLRDDEVMVGKIILEQPLNYHAYYDSYPYTLSPLSRGILS